MLIWRLPANSRLSGSRRANSPFTFSLLAPGRFVVGNALGGGTTQLSMSGIERVLLHSALGPGEGLLSLFFIQEMCQSSLRPHLCGRILEETEIF